MFRSAVCVTTCLCVAPWCAGQQTRAQQAVPNHAPASNRQPSPTYPRVPVPDNAAAALTPHYPRVIFRNGLLTIQAQNSSLAEVLTAVHHATGASLEMPPTASNERVAVNLGPAPPTQVLTSLLNGAPYDYVLLSRPENPGDLQTVIVREKAGGGGETGGTQAYNAPPQPEPVEQPEAMPEPEVQEATPENQEQPEQPVAEQPPAEQATPAQPQPNQQPGAQQENGENQPKTPEQLLEELKRMQMQQQQQQQQGPQQGPVPQQQPPQPDGQPQPQPDGQPQQPPQPQEADTPPQNPIQ